MSFKRQKSTGEVDLSKVYTSGLHLIGPDYAFKPFRADAHFETLSKITTYSTDKVEVTISCSFQYFLKEEDLADLHAEYDIYYKPVIRTTANAAVKSRASQISVAQFIRDRDTVETALFKNLADRLGGKCCRKNCAGDACKDCIAWSQCKRSDKGLFVEVRYFQLLAFDINEDIKSRYLRQVTEKEQEEQANFELQEKVVRKETERQKNEILNEAAEIAQNATSIAAIITAQTEADTLVKVENARNTGLAEVFSALNITSEQHKASYIYLNTIRQQEKAKLSVNYDTLMAKD
ncbi:uncharacterized protein LOC5519620 [Nematostella vectensis]|uniref:uncharacterized protein LOC5519620 n=1 Tax=Nematostella vectensis TaxID=45351 RepID=UPI002077394D|nr:uncharacterized protein LOC5519620 [Nematostella vectensis]